MATTNTCRTILKCFELNLLKLPKAKGHRKSVIFKTISRHASAELSEYDAPMIYQT